MSQTAVASIGFAGAAAALLVDGRHAVAIAAVMVAAALIPGVTTVAGGEAAAVLLLPAAAAGPLSFAATAVAQRSRWIAGLDPLVPVLSPRDRLFGPRSLRAAAGVAALPAASWVSFNLPIGGLPILQGVLFATAYVWLCGAARLLLAATVEDLTVAGAMISLAGAATWVIQGGTGVIAQAALLSCLAPACALTAGWLAGRHARRVEAPG